MQVTTGFDYVLVLEWLGPQDRRTGFELHNALLRRGLRSELVVCASGDDVRSALADATTRIHTNGVPAVHLETHGTDPFDGDPRDIHFGVGSGVEWGVLGEWLAPLNAASGFRLLVVSAACWGSGVMKGMGAGEHSAPFACAVGFRTAVVEGKLLEAMRELYRSLKSGLELTESVCNAQRELVAGQEMRLEVAVELAIKMLRRIYYGPPLVERKGFVGPARRRRRAREVWNTWFPLWLQDYDPVYRFEVAQIETAPLESSAIAR